MRTQRNNQLLRELEGGSEQDAHLFGHAHGGHHYQYDHGTTNERLRQQQRALISRSD